MTDPFLTIWVVFNHPRDYPDKVVVRGQDIVPGSLEPRHHPECRLFDSLEAAREPLERRGLHRLPRHPSDDPCIVEAWI